METNGEIEVQLWDYIDGTCSEAERERISIQITNDEVWTKKFRELSAFQAELAANMQLDQPSMRFGKNVMESVAATYISPATKQYTNNSVIGGIAAFFILLIIVLTGYELASVNWASSATIVNLPNVKLPSFDISSLYTSATFNGFLAINVALGLVLLDEYLRRKKKENLAPDLTKKEGEV